MAAIDAGTLVLLICLGIVAVVLTVVGSYNLRMGQRGLPLDLVLTWSQRPRFLFGINNIIFACLLVFILLLILFTGQPARSILFALIGLTFLSSLALVTMGLLASVRLSTLLQQHVRQQRAEQAGADNKNITSPS